MATREICEFIWALERRFELVDTTPGGFPLWPALRTTLAQRLGQRLQGMQAPHQASHAASWPARWARRADQLALQNPYLAPRGWRQLMIEHPRSEVHSADLEEQWDRDGIPWLALTDPSPTTSHKLRSTRRRSTSFIYEWAKVESRVRGFSLPTSYRAVLCALDEEARRRFGFHWGVETFATQRYRALSGRKLGYLRLLESARPSKVFIVVAYGSHVAVTAAAQSLGIGVCELQHGAYSRYHLGYAYPDRTAPVPGFPNEFSAWSQEWATLLHKINPISEVVVHTPRWLSTRRERYASVRKERTVLVLSQGSLGDAIAREFAKIADRFAGYRCLYKLHPGEYGRGRDYPHLEKLVATRGVEVLRECDLEDEMARAEVVVGVYSTALYEALELGCRALLLPLPGVEAMQDLLDSGRAEMV